MPSQPAPEDPQITLTLTDKVCRSMGWGMPCGSRMVRIEFNEPLKSLCVLKKGFIPSPTTGCLNWRTGCAMKTLRPLSDVLELLRP